MVENATMNPTNPTHREAIMWKDLSPVVSECLQTRINSFALPEQEEDLPSDKERDQSCKHPGWGAE